MPWQPPSNPKPTRAKFYVQSVKLEQWGVEVILRVVSRGADNKSWATSTPQGEIKMVIANDVAAEQFWFGQEWYVDFSPIPVDKREVEGMEHVDHGPSK